MQYGQLSNLNWLWWAGLLVVIAIACIVRHERARASFATPELLRQMVTANWTSSVRSLVLSLLALVAIIIGLVDIRWGRVWREVPQRGIEVMFVLDVSRSMLAQDTSPNRLERSKRYIKDMIQEMGGDRVGLVVFAGDVKKQIPLTNHYSDFTSSLEEIGPHNVDRGGSNLADAIEVAADAFLEKTSEHRAIVLFTDGEYHESEPIDAAKKALAEHGTRVFTVGIGDSDAGARIPTPQGRRGREGFLQYEGEMVLSKRNDGVLEQIALTTDGAYIPAGTKQVDMAAVYHRFIADIEQQDFESARVNSYVPRYHWFFGFALIMLVLDVLMSTWKRKPQDSAETAASELADEELHAKSSSVPVTAAGVAMLMAIGLFSESTVNAQDSDAPPQEDPVVLVQQGQAALSEGNAEAAVEHFSAAESLGFSDARLSYNKGIAQYNLGDLSKAREAFSKAAISRDDEIAGRARYNLGNSFYAEALQQIEQDPQTAIASLEKAIEHFRRALACTPGDRDARANIELADRLRRQLQQQQEQQPQDQNQQQQDQNENQQDSESDSQESSDDQQDQEQHQENNQQDNKEEKGENSQQESEDKNKNDTDQNEGQQQNQDGEADDESETESQQSSGGEEEKDPPPEGDLESINESQDPVEAAKGDKEGPPMTMQEARKLLQAVRDREFKNRLEQLRRMRPRRVAVEKDW